MGKYDTMPMEIEIQRRPDCVVVAVTGSVTNADADELRVALEKLAMEQPPLVVLDLKEVDFICSLGLSGLINMQIKSRHHQGKIHIASPQRAVKEMLEMSRLTTLFPTFASLEEAIKG